MNKSDEYSRQSLRKQMEEGSKPFMDALEQNSDRALAIISACLIDNMLEKLIRAFYVKDPAVNSIFKTDHILQSFFSKINIAYFSGLIPKVIYHDLKLICEIRNKFAHGVTVNLTFDSTVISQRISKCELRPKTMDDTHANKIKFVIIIQQLIDELSYCEHLLSIIHFPNLAELLKLTETPWENVTLTKDEIIAIIKKEIAKDSRKKEKQ